MKIQVRAEQKEDFSMASIENQTKILATKDTVRVNSVTGSAIDINNKKYIGEGFEAEFKVTSRWEGALHCT